jgi:hypothetical protein
LGVCLAAESDGTAQQQECMHVDKNIFVILHGVFSSFLINIRLAAEVLTATSLSDAVARKTSSKEKRRLESFNENGA